MNLETQLREGERALAHIWKATALRGARSSRNAGRGSGLAGAPATLRR